MKFAESENCRVRPAASGTILAVRRSRCGSVLYNVPVWFENVFTPIIVRVLIVTGREPPRVPARNYRVCVVSTNLIAPRWPHDITRHERLGTLSCRRVREGAI